MRLRPRAGRHGAARPGAPVAGRGCPV